MKIKIIERYNLYHFEEEINLFVQEHNVVDIKYSTTDYRKDGMRGREYYSRYSALIIYEN